MCPLFGFLQAAAYLQRANNKSKPRKYTMRTDQKTRTSNTIGVNLPHRQQTFAALGALFIAVSLIQVARAQTPAAQVPAAQASPPAVTPKTPPPAARAIPAVPPHTPSRHLYSRYHRLKLQRRHPRSRLQLPALHRMRHLLRRARPSGASRQFPPPAVPRSAAICCHGNSPIRACFWTPTGSSKR